MPAILLPCPPPSPTPVRIRNWLTSNLHILCLLFCNTPTPLKCEHPIWKTPQIQGRRRNEGRLIENSPAFACFVCRISLAFIPLPKFLNSFYGLVLHAAPNNIDVRGREPSEKKSFHEQYDAPESNKRAMALQTCGDKGHDRQCCRAQHLASELNSVTYVIMLLWPVVSKISRISILE